VGLAHEPVSGPAYKPEDGKYHAYGAFDVTQDPPELVMVGISRAAVREQLKWREDADNLRIRRAQFKPYQS
jgi:hypothetical protein